MIKAAGRSVTATVGRFIVQHDSRELVARDLSSDLRGALRPREL
jgi:hypothetical protein